MHAQINTHKPRNKIEILKLLVNTYTKVMRIISTIAASKKNLPKIHNFTWVFFLQIDLPMDAPQAIHIKNNARVYENVCGTVIPAKEIKRIQIISWAKLKNPLKKDTR